MKNSRAAQPGQGKGELSPSLLGGIRLKRLLPLVILLSAAPAVRTTVQADPQPTIFEIPADVLEDKIRGGMLGQIIGNLNGLPHEAKYIREPGNVTTYAPHLPDGARTDDDTDLEWVYVTEIERTGEPLLPPQRVVQLWKTHVNDGIWCANRYARDLMELGFEPPATGSHVLNPWSHFNISGQFLCESFGLMAPAMPQTASRIGLQYTHVAIDGEPAQATQLFTSMIALSFAESRLDRVIDGGLAAVDPDCEIAAIVGETRRLCQQHPDDWRRVRGLIQERWQRHDGAIRDWNGYELNTACTIAALEYGRGDFVETLRLAFNFGWDCDNNAATAATIVGVLRGRRWMNAQGWDIADVYRNTTREQMPTDETISGFENRVIACARIVILRQGGEEIRVAGRNMFRIRAERPANVEPLAAADVAGAKKLSIHRSDLSQPMTNAERARAAYIAICTGEAERLQRERPRQWAQAATALQSFRAIIRDFLDTQIPSTARIREQAARVGVTSEAGRQVNPQP